MVISVDEAIAPDMDHVSRDVIDHHRSTRPRMNIARRGSACLHIDGRPTLAVTAGFQYLRIGPAARGHLSGEPGGRLHHALPILKTGNPR
jgi:hypothetical protein